ncbi:MarR family transcriptional regulator [Paenibacillus lupini]|jgi:hypothetical protein|uniref:MarR family transcriptional regulator n=1 Tax=Paenibacillus lupini TaxID=1450204 RepID=UPI001422AAAA|nr:MarR family transcriptional regulator [Paenibacillus lupini]NIK21249.1 DNA-binding PadR family transcriptional regulator [Paenibacillus lupini]
MNLTPTQQTVLLTLTKEWLSPVQLSERLPKDSGNLYSVNQSLKDLVKAGLAQVNPVVYGLYRLTAKGTTFKEEAQSIG